MRAIWTFAFVTASAIAPHGAAAQEGKLMLTLTSPAFAAGQPIPKK